MKLGQRLLNEGDPQLLPLGLWKEGETHHEPPWGRRRGRKGSVCRQGKAPLIQPCQPIHSDARRRGRSSKAEPPAACPWEGLFAQFNCPWENSLEQTSKRRWQSVPRLTPSSGHTGAGGDASAPALAYGKDGEGGEDTFASLCVASRPVSREAGEKHRDMVAVCD